MTHYFDVIICGAGPAGSTTALAMGSSGLKVGLIEKKEFPRDKVCGDAIPPYVPKVLDTINPEYAKVLEKLTLRQIINTCRIFAPNKKVLDLQFQEHGFICRRVDFDNLLFGLAAGLSNVTVFQNTTISDVRISENECMVYAGDDSCLNAKLIIGCDGANSITRRKLTGKKNDLNHCSSAVRAYFRNIKDIPEETYELHFLKKYLPGYLWIFPLPGNISNVGLGMPSGVISQKNINLREELLTIINSVPYLKERFSEAEILDEIKGHLLPLGSRKIPVSGHRFMLCGDAASLINPASGAGTGQAMQSGRYAGWQAVKCFERNDFSSAFMKEYDRVVCEKILKEDRRSIFIRKIISSRNLLNLIVNAGSRSRFINTMILNTLK